MKNRAGRIVEMLAEEQKIEVTALSERLGVSQVTVRKDLDALERQGVVTREHGYALLRNDNDVGSRLAYHFEAKGKIARRAAELVQDGDTVMIENGSCCALLAALLAETKKDLTILTNSAFIAAYIREKPGAQTVLLGGIYQPDSQVMVGPLVRQCAENFYVRQFFIGVDGWSGQTGFTNKDQLRAQAVRDMALQAEQVVVLTESEKFSRRGVVPLNLKGKAHTVITDGSLPPEAAEQLRQSGVSLLTVE